MSARFEHTQKLAVPTYDLALLKRHVAAIANGCGIILDDFQITGPQYSRPFSRVYRIDIANSDQVLALKLCLRESDLTPNERLASSQFHALSRCYERVGGSKFCVPKPYGALPKEGLILMEWVQGDSLRDVLRKGRYSKADLFEKLFRAGVWLRNFHDASLMRSGVLKYDEMSRELTSISENMGREGLNSPWLSRAIARLRAHVEKLDGIPIQASWIHPDFQPGNILYISDRVIALDIAVLREGPTFADAAHFVNNIFRLCHLPRGMHLFLVRDKLILAFLEGFSKGTAVDFRAFNWFRALDDLRFLIRFFKRQNLLRRCYISRVQGLAIARSLHQIELLSCDNGGAASDAA